MSTRPPWEPDPDVEAAHEALLNARIARAAWTVVLSLVSAVAATIAASSVAPRSSAAATMILAFLLGVALWPVVIRPRS